MLGQKQETMRLRDTLNHCELEAARGDKENLQFFAEKSKEMKTKLDRLDKKYASLEEGLQRQHSDLAGLLDRQAGEQGVRYQELVHAIFEMCARL
jgi:hypothetical protein